MSNTSPLVLCILDGWGYREDAPDNSISQAHTPHWDKLWANSPHCLLDASGEAVGLPAGQMGNSEVGHMNLGAGRVIHQDLPRIDKAIAEGSLAHSEPLTNYIKTLKETGGICHLLGLFSPGGVHSHHQHILALAQIIVDAGIPLVFHPFLDGRDTSPKSAKLFLTELMDFCQANPNATVGSVGGRYYAMDRDQRWERIELAYNAMVLPTAATPRSPSPLDALEHAYSQDITDEFVAPTAIGSYMGMNDGDGVLVANFRADRVRQITQALLNPHFNEFHRIKAIDFSMGLSLIEYSSDHRGWLHTLFPSEEPQNTLGEVISTHNLMQLRAAETEKYAHVTFFFNGGREAPFPNEERLLIPSPKVKTYDLKPEMAAPELTKKLVKAIESKMHSLIVVNYANPDMVGHTGDQEATQIAIETIDQALGQIMESIDKTHGTLIVTADHGNAEVMIDEKGNSPLTSHTLNPVPFVIYAKELGDLKLNDGKLADVAPTILKLIELPQPEEMTGEPLFK